LLSLLSYWARTGHC